MSMTAVPVSAGLPATLPRRVAEAILHRFGAKVHPEKMTPQMSDGEHVATFVVAQAIATSSINSPRYEHPHREYLTEILDGIELAWLDPSPEMPYTIVVDVNGKGQFDSIPIQAYLDAARINIVAATGHRHDDATSNRKTVSWKKPGTTVSGRYLGQDGAYYQNFATVRVRDAEPGGKHEDVRFSIASFDLADKLRPVKPSSHVTIRYVGTVLGRKSFNVSVAVDSADSPSPSQ